MVKCDKSSEAKPDASGTREVLQTLRRTTLVGFFRISVSGLASDFLEGSPGWAERKKEGKKEQVAD